MGHKDNFGLAMVYLIQGLGRWCLTYGFFSVVMHRPLRPFMRCNHVLLLLSVPLNIIPYYYTVTLTVTSSGPSLNWINMKIMCVFLGSLLVYVSYCEFNPVLSTWAHRSMRGDSILGFWKCNCLFWQMLKRIPILSRSTYEHLYFLFIFSREFTWRSSILPFCW